MSFKLAVMAFEAKVGSPLRKLVLLKLADQANDEGVCWPSYETIAEACEVDRRSVMRHVKKLEEDGFLWVERTYNTKTKKNASNRYHLTIGKGLKAQESNAVSSDNLTPPLVTDCHHPSDTESPTLVTDCHPPSDTESPKPIIEPISIEPIIEPKEKASNKESNSNSKKSKSDTSSKVLKPDDVLDQTWSDLLKLRNAKKSPLSVTAWNRALTQIELIQQQTSHSIEQIIGEWIEAGWTTVKLEWYIKRTSEEAPEDNRFNIDKEDWSQSNTDNAVYHPSHSTSAEPTSAKTKYNPETQAVIAGMIVSPFPNMTPQETMDYVANNVKPGETSDETYRRLFNQLQGGMQA